MTINSVAVLGAGTMGAQIALHCANAGIPGAAARPDAGARARRASRRRAGSSPIRSSRPTSHRLVTTAGFDEGMRAAQGRRLDHRSRRRAARHQAAAARARRRRRGARARSSARTRRASRSARSPKAAATTSGGTGSARTSSIRRATCGCSRSSRPPTPIRRSSTPFAAFADHHLGKGVVVAKDTPNFIGNHIALYGVVRTLEARRERPLHHRRGRRDHRAGARPARQRDVPDDGHRRPRRARRT